MQISGFEFSLVTNSELVVYESSLPRPEFIDGVNVKIRRWQKRESTELLHKHNRSQVSRLKDLLNRSLSLVIAPYGLITHPSRRIVAPLSSIKGNGCFGHSILLVFYVSR